MRRCRLRQPPFRRGTPASTARPLGYTPGNSRRDALSSRGARHHGMHRQILIIARFTLLEALRTRLLLLAAVALVLALAGSMFVQQIAITETGRVQASFFAAFGRATSIFLLCLYVISSMVREFNDKGLELLLSLDLPRSSYLAGKAAGFVAVAAVLACGTGAALAIFAPPDVVLVWSASLFLELAIMTGASLFCIVTFHQIVPAALFVTSFYLLARSANAMRLMAESSLLGTMEGTRPALALVADAIGYMLPTLDRYTVTTWITEAAVDADVLAALAMQSAIYTTLLLAAAMFDLYRREL
jgi:ABC-type transport system involved in multi-copper enzyme maturation permease subunit